VDKKLARPRPMISLAGGRLRPADPFERIVDLQA